MIKPPLAHVVNLLLSYREVAVNVGFSFHENGKGGSDDRKRLTVNRTVSVWDPTRQTIW